MSKPNMEKFPSVVGIPTNSIQANITYREETAGEKRVDVQRHSHVSDPSLGSVHLNHINSCSLSVPLPSPKEICRGNAL